MVEKILRTLRRLIPAPLFSLGQPIYHYLLAIVGRIIYGNPSGKIHVVAVTGTKGKTTVVELLSRILEEAGFTVASSSTVRSKIAGVTEENLFKMTTPGRFFLQNFLSRAVKAKCEYAVIEMTSQAVVQYRHRGIDLDGLIFTGIHPEHIEAHGSFENYLASKLKLAEHVARSSKRPRAIVSNLDDQYGQRFLHYEVESNIGFSKSDAGVWKSDERGTTFTFVGVPITSPLPGEFNLTNILAAATYAKAIGVGPLAIKKGVEAVAKVEGRMESLDTARARGIEVIIDYAHTTGSLEAVYKLFTGRTIIGVLGSCGGGRDKWKRPELGAIAEANCTKIILTNEDPYDEDPEAIVGDMIKGMKDQTKAFVEMDRRKAISTALRLALEMLAQGKKPVVLITGKGTDPYIMGAKGSKQEWSDKLVAEEELAKLG